MSTNIVPIMIYVVLAFIAVRYFFAKAQESKAEANRTMTDEHFIIKLPMNYFVIGVIVIIIFGTIVLIKTLDPNETFDGGMIVFYCFFGGFIWISVYFALKAVKSKIVVEDDRITVYPAFGKPYSFMFSEVVSVFRELSYNRLNSEGLEIKTKTGRIIKVASAEISYERLLRRIKSEVKSEFLDGFE